MTLDLRGGCAYGQHGNATVPTLPHAVPSSAYGCGDYTAWLAAEAWALTRDERHDREDRLCPFDGLLSDGVSAGMFPTPWAAERRERVAVAGELMDQGLRGVELDAAIDLTTFARHFLRWAEEGFPFSEKGTT